MRWVVGYGLYLVSERHTLVRPPASPCMSSSTRYNPYPTPAYLITNNIMLSSVDSTHQMVHIMLSLYIYHTIFSRQHIPNGTYHAIFRNVVISWWCVSQQSCSSVLHSQVWLEWKHFKKLAPFRASPHSYQKVMSLITMNFWVDNIATYTSHMQWTFSWHFNWAKEAMYIILDIFCRLSDKNSNLFVYIYY